MEKGLIIFKKNPELGKAKTRLAKGVGKLNALIIYKHLLSHSLKVSLAVNSNRLLFYEDCISYQDEWPQTHFEKYIQHGDSLGERMFQAFEFSFSKGNSKSIIIGTDCMDLDAGMIESAFAELDHHDFVIGPAKDGGYYLLGMNYAEPSLFQNKNWSTNTVAAETLADISALNKTVCTLPELSDIDTIDDLSEELKKLINWNQTAQTDPNEL